MKTRQKRTAAFLPMLLVPLGLLLGQGLACELLVNVDRSLVDDGGPGDVLVPATLDGYDCPICRDVSADANFDGDETFPEAEPEDSPAEAASPDANRDASLEDTGASAEATDP
jgi:hypothetical protein